MGAAAGGERMGSLRLRVLSAVIGLPLVLGAAWIGGPALLLLGCLAALAGLWELRAVTAAAGALSLTVAGAGSLAFMAAAWQGAPLPPPLVAVLTVGGLLWHMGRSLVSGRQQPGPVAASWALSVAGALYPAGLLSYGLLLRGLENGREWLLLALLVTFASDSGAYLMGRAVGRHAMAPRLSPGKTWEGAAGGIVASAFAALALALAFGLPVWTLIALGVGAGLSLAAQAGDLAESFLKRAGGVKEAGWLVPGHGGILDRLDSVVLVLPAAYYGLVWLT